MRKEEEEEEKNKGRGGCGIFEGRVSCTKF